MLFFSLPLLAQEKGKSYIEEFFRTYDKQPENFQAFIDELKAKTFEGKNSRSELVEFPVSRSLQKSKVNHKFPRKIVAISTSEANPLQSFGFQPNNLTSKPQTFIGYAPEGNSFEVISWNPQLKKYVFFQVENFGPGQKPKLVKSEQKTCLECHQSGGPIFSNLPWAESSQTVDTNAAQKHAVKTQAAQSMMTAEELKLQEFAKTSGNNRFGIFEFDSTIRLANRRLQFEKLCGTIKEDLKARDILLLKYMK